MVINEHGNHEVYIYALVDPRNCEVRYIGQTVNMYDRYKQHLCTDKPIDFVFWWWDATEYGDDVIMYALCGTTKEDANKHEQHAIDTALANGCQLFNVKGTTRIPPKDKLCVRPPIPSSTPYAVRQSQKAVTPYVPRENVPELTYHVPLGSTALNDERLGYNVNRRQAVQYFY
mgnify:CR=1 FL=1|jgi:hypothetical protein